MVCRPTYEDALHAWPYCCNPHALGTQHNCQHRLTPHLARPLVLHSTNHASLATHVPCAQIPLVPFSDAVKEAAFADFAARVDASPQELPSCCFFTFVNTRQSLCSMAFSDDAEHVAGGFVSLLQSVKLSYEDVQLFAISPAVT